MAHRQSPFNFMQRLEACMTQEDLLQLLQDFLAISYDAVAVHVYAFGVSRDGKPYPDKPLLSTFPATIQDYYFRHEVITCDPMVRAALGSNVPIILSEGVYELPFEPHYEDVYLMMEAEGYADAAALQICTRPGQVTYIAMAFRQLVTHMPEVERRRMKAYVGMVLRRIEDLAAVEVTTAVSNREQQVLTLLAYGASNKEIARALKLSPHTVNTLMDRAYRKLGVKTRMQAAIALSRKGLPLVA